jgi:hypothetical protein
MQKLSRETLMSLEQYAEARPAFRAQVIAHKVARRVALSPNATLYFEDFLTMQYQVQEMLRVERIFEVEGIMEEIEAYNPLIPDGQNWKATFMLEYADVAERKVALAELVGVENQVYVRIGDGEKTYAIADEDLDRATEEKTSSVHFMRFELTTEQAKAVHAGAAITFGADHAALTCELTLDAAQHAALAADLTAA